jgi:hypothetical protein
MNKQFVTYKIALKLKELGFDEECLGAYMGHKLVIVGDSLIQANVTAYEANNYIKAPLWQGVIDWFREKYDNNIIIMPCFIPSNEIKYYIFKGKLKWDWNELYNTYEEAREQAILKTIELIKEK